MARLLGLVTSNFPGVTYGPLQMEKIRALKTNKGNFDKTMSLSHAAISDINWWIAGIFGAYNLIGHGDPDITMTTDASLTGWVSSLSNHSTGGNWSP